MGDKQNGRRRRGRRRRSKGRRHRRRRKKSVRSTLSSHGSGLAKALLGPELGANGNKHANGRRKRKRRRRRKRKRSRSFGAMVDIDNMSDNLLSENDEIDTQTL